MLYQVLLKFKSSGISNHPSEMDEGQYFKETFLPFPTFKEKYACLEISLESDQLQPWELVAAFGNAIVNAILCWFYNARKCRCKGFLIRDLSFQVLQCF